MGVNSLPKTVTRQRRGCDLNPGPSAPESSTLTTRLPSRLDLALNPPLVLAISQSVTRTDGKVPFAGDSPVAVVVARNSTRRRRHFRRQLVVAVSPQRGATSVVRPHCVVQSTRSTQPCIPTGSLNRVPASAGVRAGMSALPGGR